jgi:hypothetical protein
MLLERYEAEAEDARQRAREAARERADRLYAGDWLGGRLLAHGKAPYRFDPESRESYYVRLQTADGRQVLWGTDLERAIRESKSHAKVGDAVGVRILSREKLDGDRTWNRWQIDKAIHIVKERRVAREILEDPVTARRAGKDGATLTGSYLLVTAAEMLARVQFTDETSRKEFVAKVREAAGITPRSLEDRAPVAQGLTRNEQGAPRDRESSPQRVGFARE